jgi:hypothetical protein
MTSEKQERRGRRRISQNWIIGIHITYWEGSLHPFSLRQLKNYMQALFLILQEK